MSILVRDGVPCSIGRDEKGREVIFPVGAQELGAAGINALITNPGDKVIQNPVHSVDLPMFYCARHGNTTDKPLTVIVFVPPIILDASVVLPAVLEIDLSAEVPAAGLHCWTVVFWKTDNTLEAASCTAISTADPLEASHLFEAIDGGSAGAIPVWAWKLADDQTVLTSDPTKNLDMRQFINLTVGTSSSGLPEFGAGVIKTLSSGVAAAGSDRHLIIAAETGTSDTLSEITGLNIGDEVIIRPDSGDTITVEHNNGGATDKLLLYGAANLNLTGDQTMKLVKTASGKVVQYVDATATASGDAPADAKYITSASNTTLTNEIIIPGMAGDPDVNGRAGGGTADKEFDSGASPFTWDSAPASEDVNTTALSHFYVSIGADNTERRGLYNWTPGSGAFDVRMKVALGSAGNGANINGIGLIVETSDGTTRALCLLQRSSNVYQTQAYTYASSTYTQRGVTFSINVMECYLRIARDGSNNFTFYTSTNGIVWQVIGTHSITFTVAKVGLRLASSATAAYDAAVDWIRSSV